MITRRFFGFLAIFAALGVWASVMFAGETEPVTVTMSEPATVLIGPPIAANAGLYQFPNLSRLPNGDILFTYQIGRDMAEDYGLPPGMMISSDEGQTWRLPKEGELTRTDADPGWYMAPTLLPNGDRIKPKILRSLDTNGMAMPDPPVFTFQNYDAVSAVYPVESLPEAMRDGWRLYRQKAGESEWQEEKANVQMEGETRENLLQLGRTTMPLPWMTPQFVNAPDGSLFCVDYTTMRSADPEVQKLFHPTIFRSTDSGHTWQFWSEIPYNPDPAADPLYDKRAGFTEPYLHFMPDGSAVIMMRTEDGLGTGPFYLTRSTDNAKTWSKPVVFDKLGVWPYIGTLKNGVSVAIYGRPGLYLRTTTDPEGLNWNPPTTILPPEIPSCCYQATLPLSDDTLLVGYGIKDMKNEKGEICKGFVVRKIRFEVEKTAK